MAGLSAAKADNDRSISCAASRNLKDSVLPTKNLMLILGALSSSRTNAVMLANNVVLHAAFHWKHNSYPSGSVTYICFMPYGATFGARAFTPFSLR